MKIFGWMQRKLQMGTEYQKVAHKNNAPDVKSKEIGAMKSVTLAVAAVTLGVPTGEKEEGVETVASLLHHHILLTIGTFGYSHPDPLHLPPSQQPQEENNSKLETEGKPFPPSTLEISKPEPIPKSFDNMNSKQEAAVVIKLEEEEEEEEEITSVEPLLKEDRKRNTMEKRTTLADLFAAERALPPSAAAPHAAYTCGNNKEITTLKKMKKKKKKSKAGDPRVAKTKTMHGLIARMLRKKIYPDGAHGEEPQHGKRGELDGAVNLTC